MRREGQKIAAQLLHIAWQMGDTLGTIKQDQRPNLVGGGDNLLNRIDSPQHIGHVLMQGRIVREGGPELALELEEKGYDFIREEVFGNVS